MSTTYYGLRHPVASLDMGIVVGLRDEDGRLIGNLAIDALACIADRDNPVARRSGGRITVTGSGPDSAWTISEYGEPVTLGSLRRGEAP